MHGVIVIQSTAELRIMMYKAEFWIQNKTICGIHTVNTNYAVLQEKQHSRKNLCCFRRETA